MLEFISFYGRGFAMGLADLVPGVSGGTVALLTGVYQRLVSLLASLNVTLLRDLKNRRWDQLKAKLDLKFCAPLGLGIVSAIIVGARAVKFLLANYETTMAAFFMGLVVSSSLYLFLSVKRPQLSRLLPLFFIFALATSFLVTRSALVLPDGVLMTFVAGTIAICAMLLPGVSGSFLLLLLGRYEFILEKLRDPFNGSSLLNLALFAAGCAVGLLSFSRLLNWFLKNYHDESMYALAGMLLGSLVKLWPWQAYAIFSKHSMGVKLQLPELNLGLWPSVVVFLLPIVVLAIFQRTPRSG